MQLKTDLPNKFVLDKPLCQESYDESLLYELEKTNKLIITRKRDGWKMFALVNVEGVVKLYTDGINEIDYRLDHIKKEIKKLQLPPKTLLVGEIIWDSNDRKNNDDVTKIVSIFSSNIERALELQAGKKVCFIIFNIIFWDGKYLDKPFDEILSFIKGLLYKHYLDYVSMISVLDFSLDQSKEFVKSNEWEGLVLYDKSFKVSFRLDGKVPKRTKGCYKWKPVREDDFIVRERIFRPGTRLVKEVMLLQVDPKTG